MRSVAAAVLSEPDARGHADKSTYPAHGRSIMLRGRYGFGWMIVAWLVIVALLAGGIYLVGDLARFMVG